MPERRDPLDERLRAALDRVPAPDLWRDAAAPGRPERPLPPASSPGRRIAIAAFALVVFAASLALLVPGWHRTPEQQVTSPDGLVSVSAMLHDPAGVRCTATLPAVLEPGAALSVHYLLENVGAATADVSLSPPNFPVHVDASDGTSWDTAAQMNAISWPGSPPRPLEVGASERFDGGPLSVQFPGPLAVTPTCAGTRMPTMTVAVAEHGTAPSPQDAVTRAAAAASGLFDRCMPPPDGDVVGTVAPPDDPSVAPMAVRCASRVTTDPSGFAIVTFMITAPSDAPPASVPSGMLRMGVPAPDGTNTETVVWRFVVTEGSAVSVGTATDARSAPGHGMTIGFDVSSQGWTPSDRSLCGGEDMGGGNAGDSAYVIFFDECH